MSNLQIDITYPVNAPDKFKIKSNIREEVLPHMLEEIIRLQMGKGEDNSKAKRCKTYRVFVDIDLSNDDFEIQSNTGNKGLTLGIVMDVLNRMKT
jgi:hypothetical protein